MTLTMTAIMIFMKINKMEIIIIVLLIISLMLNIIITDNASNNDIDKYDRDSNTNESNYFI